MFYVSTNPHKTSKESLKPGGSDYLITNTTQVAVDNYVCLYGNDQSMSGRSDYNLGYMYTLAIFEF